MRSTFFFLFMEVSPLSARHLARRDRQGRSAWLANKEYHEIPPRLCLPVGDVQVLTFHFSFLQPANVRPREKDFLDLIRADGVFFCKLANELFVPDHVVKAQAQCSSRPRWPRRDYTT